MSDPFEPQLLDTDSGPVTPNRRTSRRRGSASVSFANLAEKAAALSDSPVPEPLQSEPASPPPPHAHTVRTSRRKFFETVGRKPEICVGRGRLQNSALACVAGALSYILHYGGCDPDVEKLLELPLAVTMDDLMVAAKLPLNALMTSTLMTLHEAHAATTEYLEVDHRFGAALRVETDIFDVKILDEFHDSNSDIESANRAVAVSVSEFRARIVANQTHGTATLLFFDKLQVEDGWAVDDVDETESASSVTSESQFMGQLLGESGEYKVNVDRVMHSHVRPVECAIALGVTRQDGIEVALPVRAAQGGYTFKIAEFPIAVMHKAMASRHLRTGRANGMLTLGSKTDAATTPAVAPGRRRSMSPRVRPQRALFYPDLLARSRQGHPLTPRHMFPHHNSTDSGTHVTAIAMAVALLEGTGSGGVDLNRVARVLDLPTEQITMSPQPLPAVFAMARSFLAKEGLPFNAHVQPVLQSVTRTGAASNVSAQELGQVLAALRSANSRSTKAVLLANYNPDIAHCAVNVSHSAAPGAHWGIVGQFDAEKEMVHVVDTHPRKFAAVWSVTLEQLHAAMTNKGYIVLCTPTADASALLGHKSALTENYSELVDSFHFPLGVRSPTASLPVPVPGTPLSLGVVAASLLTGKPHSFASMLQTAPCGLSFLLTEHLSVWDYVRVMKRYAAAMGLDLHADATDAGVWGRMPEEERLAAFTAVLKEAEAAPGCTQLLFNFALEHVPHNTRRMRWSHNDYALFLGFVGEGEVAVLDTNQDAGLRQWCVKVADLCKACTETGNSGAAGIVAIRKGAAAATPEPTKCLVEGGALDQFELPSMHPFHTPQLPSITGIAAAMSSLGRPCCTEELIYAACSATEDEPSKRFMPTTLVAERPLRPALVVELAAHAVSDLGFTNVVVQDVSNTPLVETVAAHDTATQRLVVLYDADTVHTGGDPGCGIAVCLREEKLFFADMRTALCPAEWGVPLEKVEAFRTAGKVSVVRVTVKPE